MEIKLLSEKKGQRRLIGLVLVLFLTIFLCAVFTREDVESVNKLKAYKPDDIQYMNNGSVLLEFTVDANSSDRGVLAFLTSHKYVDAYAKGTRIYSLRESGGIWGHTTGNVWNFIKLPNYAEKIVVRLESCYPEATSLPDKFYVGTGNEIYSWVLRQSMPAFIVSVFILMVGLFITSYWLIIHKSSHIDGTLFYLGVFSILLGLWSANETNVAALMIINRRASSFAAFVLLMGMPIPFIMFVKSFLEIKDNRFWRYICDLNGLVILVSYILNFTGIYEFRRSLWMTHFIIILMLVYMFIVIVGKITKRQVDQKLKACVGALILVFAATIVDLTEYYQTCNNSGVFGRSSFLIFIIVLGIESARQAVVSLKKGRRAEELEQFALNDSMTGLYNRNAYDFFVHNETDFKNYLIVTFDINNLKRCNDNYGHSAGDAYISNSARVIENIFERFGKCYRIGGDEFCCVIPKAKGFNIQRYIQKLHQDVEILNNKNIIPTEVGIACGYAFVTETDTDIEKVRERADEMMYQNKKELKGLV